MIRGLLIAALLAGVTGAAPSVASAQGPDPCALLTTAEIRAALGSTPSEGRPRGPTEDAELQGRSWSCDRDVGSRFLSVDAFEFGSVAGAARGMDEMRRNAHAIADGIQLSDASGVGSRAMWGASSDGAIWAVLQDRYMLTLTLAGDLDAPQQLREPMRGLAVLALGRLGER